MAVTLQQVLQQLDTDEPNYPAIAAMGPEAVPHLAALVRGDDPGLASKAAYLASLIPGDQTMEVLEQAAASQHEIVRVAAAAGLRNVANEKAVPVTERLLDDTDPGVRKQAIRAAVALGSESLDTKVRAMSSRDPDRSLRAIAAEELKQMEAAREGQRRSSEPATPTKATPAKRAIPKRTPAKKRP